jgi:serine/threonine protein kinase
MEKVDGEQERTRDGPAAGESQRESERLSECICCSRWPFQWQERYKTHQMKTETGDKKESEFHTFTLSPGGSLRKLVTEQSLDWRMHGICTRDMLGWSLQLAQSVAYMHSLNPPILHRDCKLENVMLTMSPSKKWGGVDVGHMSPVDATDGGAKTSSAEVRLIDFGLAITLPDATELAQAISIHGASSYLDLMKLETDKKSPNSRKKSELGAKKKSGSGYSGGMFFMKKRHDGSVGGAGSAHSRSSLLTEHLNVSKHGGGGLYDVSGASRTGSEVSNPPPAETYSGPIHVPQQQQLPPLPLYHYSPPGAVESVRNGNAALEAQIASVVTGLEKQLSKVPMEASVHSVGRPAHLTGMTGSLMYMVRLLP